MSSAPTIDKRVNGISVNYQLPCILSPRSLSPQGKEWNKLAHITCVICLGLSPVWDCRLFSPRHYALMCIYSTHLSIIAHTWTDKPGECWTYSWEVYTLKCNLRKSHSINKQWRKWCVMCIGVSKVIVSLERMLTLNGGGVCFLDRWVA